MFTAYLTHLLILLTVFAIAGLALNLTIGWAGIINLGHLGFISIGAYSSAIVTTKYGLPMVAGVLLGMVLAGGAAALLSILTKSMHGDALAVVLLGFNFTILTITLNWRSLTRGPLGIPGIPRPELFQENIAFLLLIAIIALLVFLLVKRIVKSPFGLVLGAVRDDELHAKILGKRTFRTKVIILIISGALAGLAGALQAHAIRFIDPNSFFLHQLVFLLSIVLVGGLASLRGTFVGAMVMVFLPEIVDTLFNLPSATVGALRGIIFSVLLLLVVIYRPKGIFGKVELPNAYAERH